MNAFKNFHTALRSVNIVVMFIVLPLLTISDYPAIAQDARCENNREEIARLEKSTQSKERDDKISSHCGRMKELGCPDIPAICSTIGSTPRRGIERIEGEWTGTYHRDNNEEGGVTTVFTVHDGKLGGWHYQPSWVIEDVSVSGDTVTFSHVYGDNCRAMHTFTIRNYETRQANSSYTVVCSKGEGHSGTIKYGK